VKNAVLKHEFIGHEIEILGASQKSLVGVRGIVVDETRNMLIIHVGGEDMKIPKKYTVFRIITKNDVVIDGSKIMFRPEDRIKKIRNKKVKK
jgi:ribonuclease P protein subunit POP4